MQSKLLTVQSTSLTLFTVFDQFTNFAGNVYCAAFARSIEPSSVDDVITSSQPKSFLASTIGINVTITGLTPQTEVDIYCHIVTAQGFGSTLEDVLATRISAETSCCKTVTVVNSPSSVFGDLSKYQNSPESNYVFRFRLSHAPKQSVVITPIIFEQVTTSTGRKLLEAAHLPIIGIGSDATFPGAYSLASTQKVDITNKNMGELSEHSIKTLNTNTTFVRTNMLAISPSSFSFSSSSSLDAGFVIFSNNFNTAGTFKVVYNATGPGAKEFSTSETSFTLLSNNQVPPPPVLSRAIFSNSGQFATITFDSPTDRGQLTEIFTCSVLFTFVGSNQSKCFWTSTSSLRVSFGSSNDGVSYLVSGNSVTLKANTIKAQCLDSIDCSQLTFASSTTVTVLPPISPVVPAPVINAPSLVSRCDNVTINPTLSSGSGGREWINVQWTVESGGGRATSSILAILNSFGRTTSNKIIVPNALFSPGSYRISLGLTNLFGVFSSTTVTITISSSENMPSLVILGPSIITTSAIAKLSVFASATLSTCPSSNSLLTYQWGLFDGSTILAITSTSRNPKNFALNSYTLTTGKVYQLVSTVTAVVGGVNVASTTKEVSIQVLPGLVVSRIAGGSYRVAAVDTPLTLDASNSYDEDDRSASLQFSWSCVYFTASLFGTSCDSIFGTVATNTPLLTLPSFALSLENIYRIRVTVEAPDGRSSQSSTDVSASLPGSPAVSVAFPTFRFNTEQKLTLTGTLQAAFAVTAAWSVQVSGVDTSFSALTPINQDFTLAQVANRLPYQLSIGSNTFSPGILVTFRLTASGTDVNNQRSSLAEITLLVNTPPSGGFMTNTPTEGIALETVFSFSSVGWITDVDNLPLTYSFHYQLLSTKPRNLVKTRSSSNSLETELSAGFSSRNELVDIICTVFDVLNSTATTITYVKVKNDPFFNATKYLIVSLTDSAATLNNDVAVQGVNNAANMINNRNCSDASDVFCASLNRQGCIDTPNTCSSCLPGFTGIVGASNTLCRSNSSSQGKLGSNCNIDADCTFDRCLNGVCVAPIKTCSVQVDGSICSNRGSCSYEDISGNPISTPCNITNTNCIASCSCDEGYGGKSCEFTSDELVQRSADRQLMCSTLLNLAATSDIDSNFLDAAVASLLIVYNGDEIIDKSTIAICQEALILVIQIAASGLLTGAQDVTKQFLIDVSSNFVRPNDGGVTRNAIASASAAILDSMANGEQSISFVSGNVRLTAIKDLTTSLSNATLSAPPSEEELAYDALQPSINFVGDAASACDAGDGYVELTVVQWGVNPNANSSEIGSPILQLTSSSTARRGRRKLPEESYDGSRSLLEQSIVPLQFVPLYFVTLQFNQPQDFDFSVDLTAQRQTTNFTFPECSLFNGVENIRCSGCNISSYTNYNVTFGCSDISQLCAAAGFGSDARKLASMDSFIRTFYESGTAYNRMLQIGDDDGGGLLNTDAEVSINQFGVIFEALVGQLSSVLSTNPFTLNVEESQEVLILVGSLIMMIFGGSYVFALWDRLDHDYFLYGRDDVAEKKKRYKELRDTTGRSMRKVRRKKNYFLKKSFKDRSLSVFRFILRKKREDDYLLDEDDLEEDEITFDEADESASKRLRLGSIYDYKGANDIVNIAADSNPMVMNAKSQSFYGTIASAPKLPTQKSQKLKRTSVMSSVRENLRQQKDNKIVKTVRDFMKAVLPEDSLTEKANPYRKFFFAVFAKHENTTMFAEPSLYSPRLIRFLNAMAAIMIGLFIDTLFFGIFFPDDGTCESFTTETSCLETISEVTNAPLCQFEDGECSLSQPPETLFFVVVLAILCVIVGVPVDFFITYLLQEYCSKRPDLESIGMDSEYWLGRTSYSIATKDDTNIPMSKLEVVFNKSVQKNAPENVEDRMLDQLNSITRRQYDQYMSPSEETDHLLKEIRDILQNEFNEPILPWKISVDDNIKMQARLRAIMKFVGLLPNGSSGGLTFKQWLWYGGVRARLRKKLIAIRKDERQFREFIDRIPAVEVEDRDVAIMQRFILEQFSPFKRWILRQHMFVFNSQTPDVIDPFIYIFAWILVIFIFCFFIYWILAWGIQNGPTTFRAWGYNFMFGVFQDILMVQVFKVYIVYVIGIASLRPQLKAVYRVLSTKAIHFAIEGPTENMNDFKLVQHFSPACRVARSSTAKHLASAGILRQLDDEDWENCSYEKSSSLGMVTFLIVVLPILIAFLSNKLSDIVLDMLLPSFFSGVILVHYYLFTISVLFLLLPYFVGITFYLWKFGILRPVVRKVQQRVEKEIKFYQNGAAHAKRYNKSSRSKFSMTFLGFCRSTLLSFRTVLFYAIAYMTGNVSEEQQKRKLTPKQKATEMWFNMNLPRSLQGYVMSEKEMNSFRNTQSGSELENNSRSTYHGLSSNNLLKTYSKKYSSQTITIPDEILEMRRLEWSAQIDQPVKKGYVTALLEKGLFDYATKTNEDVNVKSTREFTRGKRAELFEDRNIITSDVEKALKRILQKYVKNTVALGSSYDHLKSVIDCEDNDVELHISSLTAEVEDIWNHFYPGGVKMSPEEREEAMEDLHDWYDNKTKADSVTNTNRELSGQTNAKTICLEDFRNWFLRLSANILRMREAIELGRASGIEHKVDGEDGLQAEYSEAHLRYLGILSPSRSFYHKQEEPAAGIISTRESVNLPFDMVGLAPNDVFSTAPDNISGLYSDHGSHDSADDDAFSDDSDFGMDIYMQEMTKSREDGKFLGRPPSMPMMTRTNSLPMSRFVTRNQNNNLETGNTIRDNNNNNSVTRSVKFGNNVTFADTIEDDGKDGTDDLLVSQSYDLSSDQSVNPLINNSNPNSDSVKSLTKSPSFSQNMPSSISRKESATISENNPGVLRRTPSTKLAGRSNSMKLNETPLDSSVPKSARTPAVQNESADDHTTRRMSRYLTPITPKMKRKAYNGKLDNL